MNKLLALGLLATLTLATVSTPVRAVDKEAINRAIDNGVKSLCAIQQGDGTWPHPEIGATALAGIALLECGVKPDDKSLQRAAEAVRKACPTVTHTYSVALSILFLDLLSDPDDVPLIESLMVRLLAGQDARSGGWHYFCPRISAEETRRLQGTLTNRKEPSGRRDTSKAEGKRKLEDLAPQIRDQLTALERADKAAQLGGRDAGLAIFGGQNVEPFSVGIGDNSNTQFAALAVWVGRRHGLPVEVALTRLDRRFRSTQQADGGWPYMPIFQQMPQAPGMPIMPGTGSQATMTCAGLLSLAICDGATLELARERQRKEPIAAISADKNIRLGLEALGTVIDNPKGLQMARQPFGGLRDPMDRVGGRTFYFLWSLERVAVALDLDTIGKKDWYGWGAEILLANQEPNGSWNADHGLYGADTCFALLFLKRANLAGDLTKHLKGVIRDPGERLMRGGVGLDKLRSGQRMKSGIENKESKPLRKPLPRAAETESDRLAQRLLKEQGSRQTELLEEMESAKGVKYTEALAAAIPRLEGPMQRKAREALANRLTRMKDETLLDYLQDDDAEIRRGAALAIGQKESTSLVPYLIPLLSDSEMTVVRAAHAALKALTGQDFGPSARATRDERGQAAGKWLAWWNTQRKKN